MQFSAVEIRFIVTTYLYSTFANDLKRKYFFSKNVHSYRVCSFNPSLVLVQSRKTRPFITERLLMGRKESNQNIKYTNQYMYV